MLQSRESPRRPSLRWARAAGLVLGLSLAVAVVVGWRVPASEGTLGLDLRIVANPSGELKVDPVGPIAVGRGLEPREGRAVEGATAVTNQTPRELSVRLRALPTSKDLDDLLLLRVTVDGTPLDQTSLRRLRVGTPSAFTLAPGETRKLGVRAWLPASVRTGYQGRIEDVALEYTATPRPPGRGARKQGR